MEKLEINELKEIYGGYDLDRGRGNDMTRVRGGREDRWYNKVRQCLFVQKGMPVWIETIKLVRNHGKIERIVVRTFLRCEKRNGPKGKD